MANLKIDIRERQEAVARLIKFRVKDDGGNLDIRQDLLKRFLDQQSKFPEVAGVGGGQHGPHLGTCAGGPRGFPRLR